jgi:regulator of sigma E protease
LLPKIGEEAVVEEGDNETEYQIGLLPIGGYVKMLGQSDTGAADANDDPRSYSNRPVGVRIATVAAGVIFNAIGAIIIFMILFMNGIDLKSGAVGHVVPNSPAYDAGLVSGDEIIKVNGKYFYKGNGKPYVDFESIVLAPALSEPGEPISFLVQHKDGTEEEFKVIAEKRAGDPTNLRYTGISQQSKLTIEPQIKRVPELVQEIFDITGLYPSDEIKAVNGQAVLTPGDFAQKQAAAFRPESLLTVSRQWTPETQETEKAIVTVSVPMEVGPALENFRDEYDLAHFGSLVPRLKVRAVFETQTVVGLPARLAAWFKETVLQKSPVETPEDADAIQVGDIILRIAGQELPNYKQLREQVAHYKNKAMPVTVLRVDDSGSEQVLELTVHPKADPASDRVLMGISPVLDMDSTVVAQVLADSGQPVLQDIPPGAQIVAVDGQPVKSFYEIAQLFQKNAKDKDSKVSIDYVFEGTAGGTAIAVPAHEPVHAQASIAVGIPFEEYTHEFVASNPVEATQMGLKKTWQFISRSYVTLGRLIQGSVPVKALSGPVGIISMTYQVAGTSLDHYLYFLALISSCLAVMNLLPLPVLDGGHIVILIIEKISGKPINERVLAGAMYVGMALLLGLVVVVTYHDLVRILFGK